MSETLRQQWQEQGTGLRRRQVLLGLSAAGTALAYQAMQPQQIDNARQRPKIDLETLVPSAFAEWKVVPKPAQTVNPQTQAILDRLYSQILERTYVNAQGYSMMLSISYGMDQRGALEAHKPDVCYPAQGFKVDSSTDGTLSTPQGEMKVRRLSTHLGERREPLTYWFTVGQTAISNRLEKRLVELKMAMSGQIPDGLLFRVSSIDKDPQHAWQSQNAFVVQLLQSVSEDTRKRLAGI